MPNHPLKTWQRIPLQVSLFVFGGLVTALLLGTLLNVLGERNFGSVVLPVPTAERVGRDYLQAAIENQQACQGNAIEQLRGAQTRHVSVESQWHSGNSDHIFESTTIRFEYRHKPSSPWQQGELAILTASNLWGFYTWQDYLPFRRRICTGG
jgi:hypothetical protein